MAADGIIQEKLSIVKIN